MQLYSSNGNLKYKLFVGYLESNYYILEIVDNFSWIRKVFDSKINVLCVIWRCKKGNMYVARSWNNRKLVGSLKILQDIICYAKSAHLSFDTLHLCIPLKILWLYTCWRKLLFVSKVIWRSHKNSFFYHIIFDYKSSQLGFVSFYQM